MVAPTGRLTAPRAVVALAWCVYGAGVLGHVLLPMTIDANDPRPWRVWIHLTPFVDVADDPAGLLLNMALFVPFGVLLPLTVRAASARRVGILALATSAGIETVQLVGALTISPGRVADVDDLIGNTLGALVGYAAFSLLVRIRPLERFADRVAWTPLDDAS